MRGDAATKGADDGNAFGKGTLVIVESKVKAFITSVLLIIFYLLNQTKADNHPQRTWVCPRFLGGFGWFAFFHILCCVPAAGSLDYYFFLHSTSFVPQKLI